MVPTAVPGFDILPASMDLLGIEVELSDNPRRLYRLSDEIAAFLGETSESGKHYNYILIDCPPSLNMLTLNAMVAAQSVLVPLQCEFFALEGLTQLLSTIEQVRDDLNTTLDVQGIVLTMYDSRNKLSEMVANDVRSHFGKLVYTTVIPRNVRISEAPSFGQPVLIYDLKCAGAQAYVALAAELLSQEKEAA